MLQTKYKTNSLMRCKNLGFAIPLGSILILLLLLVSFVWLPFDDSSNSGNMAYAVEGVYSSYTNSTNINANTYAMDSMSDSSSDTGIMPLADSPSISLSYSGSSELSGSGSVSDGESSAIVSMSSDITVNATLINSYNLQIASASDSPALEGPSTINATTSTVSTANDLANDTWGYSWNNGSYKGITNSNVSIESANVGNTNNGTVSFTKPLTFAAKFSKDANAGHYKTKVNLLLTATPKTLVTYTLSYNANGGDTSSMLSEQSISNYNDSYTFTIPNSKPTRSGYEFSGWATSSTGTVAYQPGGSITLQVSSPSQTLWAVWKKNDPWENITTMQQMTSSACAAAPIGKSKSLTDDRNYPSGIDKTYTVRKMEDGKCWMTQNLRLTGTVLTNLNSDVSSNYSLPASSKSGFSKDYAQNAYYDSARDTGYYTWCAATAGTCPASGEASSSICPKNWKLPSGGSGGEFKSLTDAEGIGIDSAASTKIRNAPYNFTYTGYMDAGSGPTASGQGHWWSRTAYNSDGASAYDLHLTSSRVNADSNASGRYTGFAVRCVTAE